MATYSIQTIDRRKTIWGRAAGVRQQAAAWMGRVFLAVADQGLISGSNFAIGILLARWMKPEQYGAYALAFSVFLLLSQFQGSIVLEPMAVFGSSTYRSRLRRLYTPVVRAMGTCPAIHTWGTYFAYILGYTPRVACDSAPLFLRGIFQTAIPIPPAVMGDSQRFPINGEL